jgi:hypothetical protein
VGEGSILGFFEARQLEQAPLSIWVPSLRKSRPSRTWLRIHDEHGDIVHVVEPLGKNAPSVVRLRSVYFRPSGYFFTFGGFKGEVQQAV